MKPARDLRVANITAVPDLAVSQPTPVAPPGWRDANRIDLPSHTWSMIFAGLAGTKAARLLIDLHVMLPGEDGRLMRKAPRIMRGRPRVRTLDTARIIACGPD